MTHIYNYFQGGAPGRKRENRTYTNLIKQRENLQVMFNSGEIADLKFLQQMGALSLICERSVGREFVDGEIDCQPVDSDDSLR